jgi:hypothetical protein
VAFTRSAVPDQGIDLHLITSGQDLVRLLAPASKTVLLL